MDNEETEDLTEVQQDKEDPIVNELFRTQALALRRLIKNSEIPVTELGKRIGVPKQNLHIWMRGQAIIPELAAQNLAKVLGVHPAELRYDIPTFNEEDLKSVVVLLELFLKSEGKELDPVSKSKMIAALYNNKQYYRRTALASFSESEFNKMANNTLKGFI